MVLPSICPISWPRVGVLMQMPSQDTFWMVLWCISTSTT